MASNADNAKKNCQKQGTVNEVFKLALAGDPKEEQRQLLLQRERDRLTALLTGQGGPQAIEARPQNAQRQPTAATGVDAEGTTSGATANQRPSSATSTNSDTEASPQQ